MNDPTKKTPEKESPDSQPNQPMPGQSGLPFDLDGADGPTAPNVQADGQAVSHGQEDSPTRPGDGAKPEADLFDLDCLRLAQDFASVVGVKKLITSVPVKKPSKEWFVRTHPDPAYRIPTAVVELKEDRET